MPEHPALALRSSFGPIDIRPAKLARQGASLWGRVAGERALLSGTIAMRRRFQPNRWLGAVPNAPRHHHNAAYPITVREPNWRRRMPWPSTPQNIAGFFHRKVRSAVPARIKDTTTRVYGALSLFVSFSSLLTVTLVRRG